MDFPAPYEIRTQFDTSIGLWWDEGCLAEIELGEGYRYMAHEIEPAEAREIAAWLLAYADAAEARPLQ